MTTNLWRGLALLWLGAASPLLSLDAIADDHAHGGPGHRPAVVGTATPADAAARIELVAPSEVVGRPLRDPSGAPAGTIRNLVVDVGSGAIAFALVGTPQSGDSVAAIPWSALHAPTDARQPALVDAAAARVAAAPHVALADTAESLSPAAAASARAWFAVPTPPHAAELVPVNRMIGTLVYAADDSETVGAVDQVMLDLRRGHVAYCVVSRDAGFRTWIPVPFAALAWSPDLGDFTFRRDVSAMERAPILPVERAVAATSATDLGALYRSFGVAAYWQPSG